MCCSLGTVVVFMQRESKTKTKEKERKKRKEEKEIRPGSSFLGAQSLIEVENKYNKRASGGGPWKRTA